MLKLKIKTRSFYSYFTIKYIYPTIAPSLSLYISLSLSLSHSLSHRSWLSIFLLFSRQPNRIQSLPLSCSISHSRSLAFALSQVFAVDFPIIFQATKQILNSNFRLFSLWSGIYSISLGFAVLKTYLWSVCFFLDSNFGHILLFAWKILNFHCFCSWIWNAMSKLNLWFCVLRAFNAITGALGVHFNEWSRRVQISLSVGLKARTCVSSNHKCLVSSLAELHALCGIKVHCYAFVVLFACLEVDLDNLLYIMVGGFGLLFFNFHCRLCSNGFELF